jgi:hypothetical protein
MYYFAANKWTFLREKSYSEGHERSSITSRLQNFLKSAVVGTHEEGKKSYFFSQIEYEHDLTVR